MTPSLRKIAKYTYIYTLQPIIYLVRYLILVAIRFFIVRKYFFENQSRKLHLGAGSSFNDGWLTSDLAAKIGGSTVYIDAVKKLPFKDNSFDFIYCEHMIEHISYEQAENMLRECSRVMKKGGRIRISTPDLDRYLSLFDNKNSKIKNDFINFMSSNWLIKFNNDSYVKSNMPYHILNLNMHAWGHQYIYCYDTLSEQLLKQGFASLKRYDNDCSDTKSLEKLEKHAYTLESRGIKNAVKMVGFESMNIEAVKK
jgi:predicted SAM-dependent methyltransferase